MKKAIDIVILPDEKIINLAININHKLNNNKFIFLNKQNQIPHISLLMGGIESKKLQYLWDKIINITNHFNPFEITINELKTSLNYTGLHLHKNKQLLNLHTLLATKIMPLLSYDNALNTIANYTQVDPKTLFWLNGYATNSSYIKFNPHITIGDDNLDKSAIESLNLTFPITFKANNIALCHLGNYCTCNTILNKTYLKSIQ